MRVLLLVLLAVFALAAQAKEVSFNGVKPVVILDVRTSGEYAAGHIEGALNVPLDQIAAGGSRVVKNLKKDSPILVYCRSGHRSAMARAALEQQGYKQILDGGAMDALAAKLKPCTATSC